MPLSLALCLYLVGQEQYRLYDCFYITLQIHTGSVFCQNPIVVLSIIKKNVVRFLVPICSSGNLSGRFFQAGDFFLANRPPTGCGHVVYIVQTFLILLNSRLKKLQTDILDFCLFTKISSLIHE